MDGRTDRDISDQISVWFQNNRKLPKKLNVSEPNIKTDKILDDSEANIKTDRHKSSERFRTEYTDRQTLKFRTIQNQIYRQT